MTKTEERADPRRRPGASLGILGRWAGDGDGDGDGGWWPAAPSPGPCAYASSPPPARPAPRPLPASLPHCRVCGRGCDRGALTGRASSGLRALRRGATIAYRLPLHVAGGLEHNARGLRALRRGAVSPPAAGPAPAAAAREALLVVIPSSVRAGVRPRAGRRRDVFYDRQWYLTSINSQYCMVPLCAISHAAVCRSNCNCAPARRLGITAICTRHIHEAVSF